jgi:hypothetical protein
MRKVVGLGSFIAFLALTGPALAATPEQQAACQNDAFRLCDQYIPDEQRVKACLIKNVRKLSPPCRQIFARGKRVR